MERLIDWNFPIKIDLAKESPDSSSLLIKELWSCNFCCSFGTIFISIISNHQSLVSRCFWLWKFAFSAFARNKFRQKLLLPVSVNLWSLEMDRRPRWELILLNVTSVYPQWRSLVAPFMPTRTNRQMPTFFTPVDSSLGSRHLGFACLWFYSFCPAVKNIWRKKCTEMRNKCLLLRLAFRRVHNKKLHQEPHKSVSHETFVPRILSFARRREYPTRFLLFLAQKAPYSISRSSNSTSWKNTDGSSSDMSLLLKLVTA